MYKTFFKIALLLGILLGCTSESINKSLSLKEDSRVLSIIFDRLKVKDVKNDLMLEKKQTDTTETFLYGSIEISNLADTNITYNLSKIFVLSGQIKSTQLYFDTFIDYRYKDEILEPGKVKRLEIYCVFEGTISSGVLDSMRIVVS